LSQKRAGHPTDNGTIDMDADWLYAAHSRYVRKPHCAFASLEPQGAC